MVILYVGLGLCFLAIVLFASVVFGRGSAAPTLADEIARYGTPAEEDVGGGGGSVLSALLGLSRRLVGSGGLEERLREDLERSGLPLGPHEWVLIRCGFGAGLVVVIFVLAGNLLVGLFLGVLLGWLLPRVFLAGKVTRRLDAFGDQLPDALQLVASSLRSGFTVGQALDRLARLDTQPLGAEMSRAVAQTKLGIGVEDALEAVAERMRCQDLSWVVLAIRIQREVGGNLAEVIDTTIETMRERTHLRRHVRALSAEGRLSAYVLIGLPLLMMAALSVLRPGYLTPLFQDPLGLVMVVLAAGMLVAGWFWMSRIIKVEV